VEFYGHTRKTFVSLSNVIHHIDEIIGIIIVDFTVTDKLLIRYSDTGEEMGIRWDSTLAIC
jgi:hypothetical protein